MRKITFALIFCFCLILFTSCAAKPININLKDLSDYIGEKIDFTNYAESDSDYIQNNYGIKPEDVNQIVVLKEFDVLKYEVLILAETADETKAQEIADNLAQIKAGYLNILKDYTANPDNAQEYAIVDNSKIWTDQNYVFWAVNNQTQYIDRMIKDYIKSNNK
ncbi:MAG: DUF4358 domain-containing protein [Oscillospiraceae bacterium]|nr:DUF4358 domain-containing protein [Oscillospiraceae bacterium]